MVLSQDVVTGGRLRECNDSRHSQFSFCLVFVAPPISSQLFLTLCLPADMHPQHDDDRLLYQWYSKPRTNRFFLNVALVMVFYYSKRNVTNTETNGKLNRFPESVRPALLFLNNELATF